KLGYDFSNVSKAIRDLVAWGYVNRLDHPGHRQRQQLAAVYETDADLAVIVANRGCRAPRSKVDNRGCRAPQIIYTSEGDIINPAEAASSPQNGADAHDFSRQEEVSSSTRPAPEEEQVVNVGAYLVRLDRAIQGGYRFSQEDLADHYNYL